MTCALKCTTASALLFLTIPALSWSSPGIVVGFAGGLIKRDDVIHQEVQLARHLNAQYALELQVRMFENRSGKQARDEVLRLLDVNHDGRLSADEKRRARIAIYGHSWGASEAVTLARALDREGIPVLLTVQVDSVQKKGEDDLWIPANVAQAANFYQTEGLLHGRREIRAADPTRTQILGNFRLAYKSKPVSCEGYPWLARMFWKPHIEIECDPAVWRRVEELICSRLLPPAG